MKTSIDFNPKVRGTVEEVSKNFKIKMTGYVYLYQSHNIFGYDSSDVEEYDFYFKGDLADETRVLARLKEEGFTDLVKELEELNNKLNIQEIAKTCKKELKRVFKVPHVLFYDELTKEEVYFLTLHRIVLSEEFSPYTLKVSTCKSSYGMEFSEEDSLKESVEIGELLERYKYLFDTLETSKNGKEIKDLIKQKN